MRCLGKTKKGTQCKNKTIDQFCHLHGNQLLSRKTGNIDENIRYLQEKLNRVSCVLTHDELKIDKILRYSTIRSYSVSLIIFCRLYGIDVSVKLFFQRGSGKYNELYIEQFFYKTIVPKMLEYTPFICRFIHSSKCSRKSLLSQPQKMREVLEAIEEIEGQVKDDTLSYNLNRMCMTVVEKMNGVELINMCELVNVNELKEILIQVAYTLMVFEEFGFMHNDLHGKNIFVERSNTSVLQSFVIGYRQVVRLKSKFYVRIFDFDRSSKSSTELYPTQITNEFLNDWPCGEFGQCEHFVKNKDWFNILHSLAVYCENKKNKSFLYSILSDKTSQFFTPSTKDNTKCKFNYPGYPCLYIQKDEPCQISMVLLNSQMTCRKFLENYATIRTTAEGILYILPSVSI